MSAFIRRGASQCALWMAAALIVMGCMPATLYADEVIAQPLMGVEGAHEIASGDASSGFRVSRVNAETTADHMGVRIGDLITHMAIVTGDKPVYRPIDSATRLREIVKSCRVGTKISIKLIRGNKDIVFHGAMRARPLVLDLLGQNASSQLSGTETAWEDVHSAIDSGDVEEGTRALSDFILEHHDSLMSGRSVDEHVMELLKGASADFAEAWTRLHQGILQSFRQRGVMDPRVLSAAYYEEDFEALFSRVFTLQLEAGRLTQAGKTLRTAAFNNIDIKALRLDYVRRLSTLIDLPALSLELAGGSGSLLTVDEAASLGAMMKGRASTRAPIPSGSGFVSPLSTWSAPRHPARGFVLPKTGQREAQRIFRPTMMVFEVQPPVSHGGVIRCVTDYPAEGATEWAVEPSTGRVLWSREYAAPRDHAKVLHYLSGGDGFFASVIVWQSEEDQSTLVDVFCHAQDGQLLWTRRLDAVLPHGVYLPVMPPVIWGSLVILPVLETSSGGALQLVALQTASAEVEWITTPESTHNHQQFRTVFTRFLGCQSGGTLAIMPMDGQVIGYDLMSGCRAWKSRLDNPRPIQRIPDPFFTQGFMMEQSGRLLVRPDNLDTVYLLEAFSGSVIGSSRGGWLVPSGTLSDGNPLFLSPGQFVSFTSLDQSRLDVVRRAIPSHEPPKSMIPWERGCLLDTGKRLLRLTWEGGVESSFTHDLATNLVDAGGVVAMFDGKSLAGHVVLEGEPSSWPTRPDFNESRVLQTSFVMHCLGTGGLETLMQISARLDPKVLADPVIEAQICTAVVETLESGELSKALPFLASVVEGRKPDSPLGILLDLVRRQPHKGECLYDMGSGRAVSASGLARFLAREGPEPWLIAPTDLLAPPSKGVSMELAYAQGKRFLFAVDDTQVILQDRITLYNLDTKAETKLPGSCLHAAEGKILLLNNGMLSLHQGASGLSQPLWTVPHGNKVQPVDPGQDFVRQLMLKQQMGAVQIQPNLNVLLQKQRMGMPFQQGNPSGVRFEGPFLFLHDQDKITCRMADTGECLWTGDPGQLVDMQTCVRRGTRFYEARWSQSEGKARILSLDGFTGKVTTVTEVDLPGDEFPISLHALPNGWLVTNAAYWARVSHDGSSVLVNGGASIENDPMVLLARTVSGDLVFQCQSGGIGLYSSDGRLVRMLVNPAFVQHDFRYHTHDRHLILATSQKVALVDLKTGLSRGEWKVPGDQRTEPQMAVAFGGDSYFILKIKTGVQKMNVYRFCATTCKMEAVTDGKDMVVQSLTQMPPLVTMINPSGTWFMRFR